jgi:pyruvate dehydrogenase E2 component (dihydrolipoamide acetyltransferase)
MKGIMAREHLGLASNKLPNLGEGVQEVKLVKWLIAPGDTVTQNQPLVEVMADKTTATVSSPKSGRILELRGRLGSVGLHRPQGTADLPLPTCRLHPARGLVPLGHFDPSPRRFPLG